MKQTQHSNKGCSGYLRDTRHSAAWNAIHLSLLLIALWVWTMWLAIRLKLLA